MTDLTAPADPRADRLFALLPAIHRARDAENGYPLKALLRVIAEQVNIVEDDIGRLYDDLFIETADDWAVPYIGDLVGYVPAPDATLPPDAGSADEPPVLVPRREIANFIRTRRRTGTLAVLAELARDDASWPAIALQAFERIAWAQNIDHLHQERHRLADLREREALERIGTPFDRSTRSADLRRPDSHRSRGRVNIPSVTVFAWRLQSFAVTDTPAACVEEAGPYCFTFSVLGQDAPLFVRPRVPADPDAPLHELELPVRIRRARFDEHPGDYLPQSLAIRAEGWAGHGGTGPVPLEQLVPADLSDWRTVPPPNRIAVDPVLGRLAFPPGQLPRKGVRVDYQYGFPAALGGGEYPRTLRQPVGDFTLYRVGEGQPYARIGQALAQWRQDAPRQAVIEIATSGVYVEPIDIRLAANQSLQLRAASGARPVLRLIDWQTDLPDALGASLAPGSRLTLDGLLITGRPVQVSGTTGADDAPQDAAAARSTLCGAELLIRHCTLVPGWALECNCDPKRSAEPSLELNGVRARVRIERSIVGAITVREDELRLDPIPLCVTDSILDATGAQRQAIGAPGDTWAHVQLEMRRCTVFGIVDVNSVVLAENSLFDGCVNVARRQLGCMRFCWVSPKCRTPRRHRCQPDGVIAAAQAREPDDAAKQAREVAAETARVTPRFTDARYGRPAYAQLAFDVAPEIARGADDASEMGVYHDLFQPQRKATLLARLADFTPAGMDAGLVFAS